ncbi:MAG: metal-binding protein [Hydrogenophilales bacterium 17-61-9]|nr:MAG: metal-binding protein [Hydrogenophilales bacterium 17-61-9]
MKRSILIALFIGSAAPAAWAAAGTPVVDVYKSPTCGCCNKWVDHLKANGFAVRSHDTQNVAAHKARLGVPAGYDACHTAQVNGYLVEGHVPAREIKRLLKEKPRARGLVVPAMPMGSPGMEADGRKDAYDVFLVNRDGSTQTYSRY